MNSLVEYPCLTGREVGAELVTHGRLTEEVGDHDHAYSLPTTLQFSLTLLRSFDGQLHHLLERHAGVMGLDPAAACVDEADDRLTSLHLVLHEEVDDLAVVLCSRKPLREVHRSAWKHIAIPPFPQDALQDATLSQKSHEGSTLLVEDKRATVAASYEQAVALRGVIERRRRCLLLVEAPVVEIDECFSGLLSRWH